jgi:hypothetical protein
MKLKNIYIARIISTLFILIHMEGLILSQEAAQSKPDHPKFFIGIGGGPLRSKEILEVIPSLSGFTSIEKNTYSGIFELGYYFSRGFGLSTGLEYNAFSGELNLSSYEGKYNTKDSENESYERRISGSDIKELQNIAFIKVPVCINLQLFLGKRFGFYIQGGINLSHPLTKEYTSSGTFTYSGYYPAYNVVFQNLPAYGFSSNAKVSSGGELLLKSINYEGLASAGFQCFVSKKIQLTLMATYNRSLSTMAEYTSPETFQLSTDINTINSMMGGSSNVTAESMGIRFTLRYYLK